MKRHIIRISLVMLLGVVTSVAVAWACAWWPEASKMTGSLWDEPTYPPQDWIWLDEFGFSGDGYMQISQDHRSRSTEYFIAVGGFHGSPNGDPAPTSPLKRVPDWCADRVLKSHVLSTAPEARDLILIEAAGWPARCLWCEPSDWSLFADRSGQMGWRIEVLHVTRPEDDVDAGAGGIAIRRDDDVRTLPLRPIWFGLLANTAIYGGVWWAMLFGPGFFLRWRRRRAGRCAKCGYDLRGLLSESERTCPECGHGDTKA